MMRSWCTCNRFLIQCCFADLCSSSVLAVCTLCPCPLWKHTWMDFIHVAHKHHPWWGLDACAVDFWFDAALLTYAALQCWQPLHCVHDHCEDMHGWISFMLAMNITCGKVFFHMHYIFDLMLHCWLKQFFSAGSLLSTYLWDLDWIYFNIFRVMIDRHMICITDILETILWLQPYKITFLLQCCRT